MGNQEIIQPDDIKEFDRTADRLGMPLQERQGVLGLTEDEYRAGCAGRDPGRRSPELSRRLRYALSLMNRSLATGMERPGPSTGTAPSHRAHSPG